MLFPERVKLLRERERYSLAELSDLVGVKGNTIWRWESGRTKPSTETIIKLAKVLNTTATYLLGETDNPTPNNQTINDNATVKPTFQTDLFSDANISKGGMIMGGTTGDMLIICDKNSNQEIRIPNNDEGRKFFAEIINTALGLRPHTVSNSINGDNNSGNNLGVINN